MYLNCHTYYSLRHGTLSPEELVSIAASRGVNCMALTDINNCTAIPAFVQQCQKHGIRPVAGMEFRQANRLLYVVLARDNEGFRRINTFLSRHRREKIPLPPRFPVCSHTFAIYPFDSQKNTYINNHRQPPAHPHEFTGIRPEHLHHLPASALLHAGSQLVALQPVSFRNEPDYQLHRHLRAIHHNILLSRLTNAHTAGTSEMIFPPEIQQKQYAGFPHILKNTENLLKKCSIHLTFNEMKNKKTFTGNRNDDRVLLEKLAFDGLKRRYHGQHKEALRRIQGELDIIHKLGFTAYFLITWDIIRYSMSQGFHHVGRGSGANSIVAYCLYITNVDPIALDLYFERFINPKRSSPPDFDIDYCWTERDQVLDYIFKRHGQAHTALLGTISTFHRRGAIRELGKVYGLPKEEIDELVAGPHSSHHNGTHHNNTNNQSHVSEGSRDSVTTQILRMADRLEGLPNIRSIHAGGVLISEEPICCYSALDLPPKGLPVVQWDMYTAEDLGFEKIDILSQRGIGHISDCMRIISETRGQHVDIHRMEHIREDPKSKALLRSGETTGCFYIESPAMRSLLKKLNCDNYSGLVAASSIVRPGVSRSGMMQEYIRRKHQPDKAIYLHPVIKTLLQETYGVMVYQEDVIKVCHHFAGLDLADADVLRRAMSGKYRSQKEMDRLTARFFEGCRAKGYADSLTREVWRQIASFAGYSFSKAHSASFAAESFQSLYLKAHYPLEFMTAVINNFGGFYRSEIYFHEARRLGGMVRLPCINHSHYLTRLKGNNLYIGLGHIRQLEQKTGLQIIEERIQDGPYRGLEDFICRTGTGLESLVVLIRTGCFRFTGQSKAKLLWQAHLLTNKKPAATPALFEPPASKLQLPDPEAPPLQDAYDEIELLGFPVSVSPFGLLQTSFRGDISAAEMTRHKGETVRMAGWLVTTKTVRTVNQEIMHFGCFTDHKGNFFDTTHFPATASRYPFCGQGVYLLKGEVTEEFGHPSLTVEKMAKLAVRPDPRAD
ncbi:MAG: DNA polymerase III subunit alpha [Bacteroidales bacterium]